MANKKVSGLGGRIVQDHNDEGANYSIVAFSHYTQEYMSLLLGMPNYSLGLSAEDPACIKGAAESMLVNARWLPYAEKLLKLGLDEVKRLKGRCPRVYIEGQYCNYLDNPSFFNDELDSRDVIFLDENNEAYDRLVCKVLEAESDMPFTNNHNIQKAAKAIRQDDREAFWVKKMVEHGDGVVLIGDSHIDRVAKALEKKGKKSCVCLNYYDLRFTMDGYSVKDAIEESLTALLDHTRRNWPLGIDYVEKELTRLGYLQQPDVKPHLPGARRVGQDTQL